ncbi:MAG: RNA 2',3'-cyclic phosphodiesterase [Bacteroidales bacterium]|jgi:2'-5' RNA ligase|nr:RNA 2',3'-cyclic phosphodiesterase [Bacteroidales bacterium]
MKRLFIATKITLSPVLLKTIAELKNGCRFDQMTWVAQDVTHLTLRFLGKTSDEQIPYILDAMRTAAGKHQPIQLSLDKLGIFGSRYAPSIIWFGFQEFSIYKILFTDLEEILTKIGFEANHGNFVPHITLARIKQVDNKKKFWKLIDDYQNIESQFLNIDHIALYQSKLSGNGPMYRELGACQVGGSV